ncbi:conserved hypothetical protein [Pyrenophora tritici-repentis Pt-1C-BFP]|uniref:Non-structural maintenance of chromosomes element 4 n=1 Tax=Pyrenophora tritici-repentis (strain Pt-1C-BFP) TaxID=426418 RepID=B2WHM7_PYRTR|nr:uncharacterized protein PTRG_09486 [Pyrenophora tritici-repentis Pt-1C-BFP]EDU42537.1 conserved hypothetical protein [Pyrenophora tritici-repentis Pt-1C-BFP]
MARLNTHLSATPQTRASTVDSLYRDPSVGPQNGDNERTSSYSVLSPSRSSDKENETPGMREKTPRGKSGGLRGASARMPTPDSGSTSGNGSKRRRTDNYSLPQSQVYEDGQDEEEQEEEGDDLEAVDTPTQTQPDNDDEEHSRFYDPHQDPEVRRRLRANMRDHARLLEDNRNDLIQSRNSGLLDILKTQNSLFGKVRQTADATVDSRFLVNASDLAGKKLNNSLGNSATGIDLDQFVSKCIYFMKSGGYVAGEENAPVIPNMDRVEEELGAIPDDELTDEDQSAALRRHRMAMTEQGEPAVSLLDFAINPKEFGQTVENLFYISFLVREGNAKIVKDEAGLPLLLPAQPRGVSEQREDNVQKHQAVFSLDYPSWQMFIQAFDIRVPLIPHRESEQTSVGSNGWYNG